MKALNTYINEKLILNKDTFKKSSRPVYKYFPKTCPELRELIYKLAKERKDNDVIDLNDIDTSQIKDMSKLFYSWLSAFEYEEQADFVFRKIDISKWDVSNVKYMTMMFCNCYELESVGDISGWDISNVKNMEGMFSNCRKISYISDLSGWNVSQVKNMKNMFSYCMRLKSTGNLDNWNVSNVNNMGWMFFSCGNLEDIGDLSNWTTTSLKASDNMFCSCKSLEFVGDLSEWNVTNNKKTFHMFYDSGITNIPSWCKK